jgi:hypothetical protein
VVRAAFDQHEALGLLRGFEQAAAQIGWISRSSLPCTTSTGERTRSMRSPPNRSAA